MKSKVTSFWILLSTLFITFSCTTTKNHEEIRWNEFYTRLLFIEGAAFTLYGSKPMTELVLDHRSKKEKERLRRERISKMSLKEKKGEKIKWNPEYDFEETWRLWEKALNNSEINKFIIVHYSRKSSDFDFVYLINITQLATELKKHYHLFQRYLGFDFDPLEVVIDIQNEESPFWNKIFNDESLDQERICLIGILFGYGLENSYPFSLVFNDHRTGPSKEFTAYLFDATTKNMSRKGIKEFSPTNFPIPGFRTFSHLDPITLKYEREKTEIIKYYSGKDLNQATLDLLYQ